MRILSTLFALALLAACTPAEAPAGDASQPRPAQAGQAYSDPAVPVQARAGQEFTLVLRANATTGYGWMLADSLDARLVARVRNDYVADPAPAGISGSGGREVWTFRALAPGETVVRMKYARSWEPAQAADSARFRVIIR